jgi:ribosomal protein S18 acetylase RimI-like enzyme
MTANIRIQRLDPAMIDSAVEAICDLPLLKRYGRTADQLRSGFSEAIENPLTDVLVALTADGPERCAGVAWFATGGTFLLGGYLKLLAVAESYQRKGVGRALLREVERRVADRSSRFFILVSDFNDGAARFYETLGYTHAGTLAGLVLPDVDERIFWKRLGR